MYPYSKLIYFLLLIATIGICYYTGKKIARLSHMNSYWKSCLPIIFSFSCFYGLRFGRLIDWNLYYERYYNIAKGYETEYEPLFTLLCKISYFVGIPYHFFIFLCAVIYIMSLLALFKPYRNFIYAILPFVFIWNGGIEMLVRWCLAVPFLIIGYCRIRNKTIENGKVLWIDFFYFFFMSLCAFFIHEGTILLIPFLLIMLFVKRKINPLFIFICVLASNFIVTTQVFAVFTDLLNLFAISDKTDNYIGNFDMILNDGLKGEGLAEGTLINSIKNIIILSYPLLNTKQIMIEKKIAISDYNIWAIGIIFMPLLIQAEILDRYFHIMSLFIGIVVGGALSYNFNRWKKLSPILKFHSVIVVIFSIYTIIKGALQREGYQYFLFIWDKYPQETIPTYLFSN